MIEMSIRQEKMIQDVMFVIVWSAVIVGIIWGVMKL